MPSQNRRPPKQPRTVLVAYARRAVGFPEERVLLLQIHGSATPENVARYLPGPVTALHYVVPLGRVRRARNGLDVVDVGAAWTEHLFNWDAQAAQAAQAAQVSDDEDDDF